MRAARALWGGERPPALEIEGGGGGEGERRGRGARESAGGNGGGGCRPDIIIFSSSRWIYFFLPIY